MIVDHRNPSRFIAQVSRSITELKPHREIRPILTNLRDLDPSFLRNALRDGVVLHGKFVMTSDGLALRPRVLLAYDLSGLAPTDKVRVSRTVHGYESRKGAGGKPRRYRYPGFKDREGAVLLTRSVLLLRPEDANELVRELERLRAPYARYDVFA